MSIATAFDIAIVGTDPRRDAATVRSWLADPHSAFWGMGRLSEEDVCDYLTAVVVDQRQDSWLGLVDGHPAFLAETYDPAHVVLTGIHDAREGDVGMHILIAPPAGHPRHGLTDAVFAAVMRWCFSTLGAERVVVEPDVRNARIAAKNARAGFRVLREVDVPEGDGVKRAALSVCTRDDFAASALGGLA
ncbi:GNAT family N-acetyltransferase [Microbacterium sp. B2969]|uniref:Lysine N-acyltransferase MbtK n=1 Tax=Microbacterium alkaliflavum TaxID=3248839 RepID=A0ABW7Q1Q3_9MICO